MNEKLRRKLQQIQAIVVAVGLTLVVTGATSASTSDKDTIVSAIISTIQSMDPAKAYDDSSATKLYNIYDTLVAFKETKTRPQWYMRAY